ncbi:MAG TPA: RDD family protein [Chryseosolibacter sp.]
MNEQILDAPTGVQRQLKYAGFWIRFAAFVIDAILLTAVYSAALFLFMGGFDSDPSLLPVLVLSVLGILYFVGMESSSRQGTFGKSLVGIKVGKANGEQISFVNALGRYFAKILSGAILYIGYMMAG